MQLTETQKKSVLMKCKDCKYEEQVPEWVLDELALGEYGSGYEMCCPNCDGTMVEKSKYNKSWWEKFLKLNSSMVFLYPIFKMITVMNRLKTYAV